MRIKFLAIFLGFCIAGTAVAEDKWLTLAVGGDKLHRAKVETFDISKNDGGQLIVSVVGQVEDKKTKRIEVQQWYVSISDCDRGFGNLVILTADGSFITEVDFVSDGSSVASGKADGLCMFYRSLKKIIEDKSKTT